MAEKETIPLKDPWLVAVWPGMGNVALIAGGYLVEKLGARMVGEFHARELFDLKHVEVKGGVARAGRLPRSMLFEWKDPNEKRDLVIFVGEGQPTPGYGFCHKLLEFATERGVRRLFTFAAMATQLHPSNDPRVFAVTSAPKLLKELRSHDVEILKDGQISGLNGVLLAAGAERRVPGICLMGELPFFAVGVPNPKASKAVLGAFTAMSGIDLDFTPLDKQAEAVEQALLKMLEKLQEQGGVGGESEEGGFTIPEFTAPAEEADESEDEEPGPDLSARQRIESLFERARQDRRRAFELKQEFDRLGVFDEYEDRFLDLFKKAE